jgi:HEAT repeat protein
MGADDAREQLDAALSAYLSDLDEDEREVVLARIQAMRATLGDDFEIVGLDDDELDDESLVDEFMTAGEWAMPQVESPADLMTQLVSAPEPPTAYALYGFSDLSREDAEVVRSQWEMVAVERRRAVIRELVEMGEEDIDLHLGRILRIAMQDPDAETRRMAVRGLWGDNGTDLIGLLIQMLRGDEDEMVRAAAATGLGGFIYLGELEELDAALAMRVEEALLAVIPIQ